MKVKEARGALLSEAAAQPCRAYRALHRRAGRAAAQQRWPPQQCGSNGWKVSELLAFIGAGTLGSAGAVGGHAPPAGTGRACSRPAVTLG